MQKIKTVLLIALAVSVLAGLTLNQVGEASAQGKSPVGVVVAYIPGQSIMIVDQNGNQTEYILDPLVKIQPPEKADKLGVGSFVTIIAPASVSKEKKIAVGIVVHPDVPKGWKIPDWTATPLVKDTPVPTDTPAAMTETPKVDETTTPTETATATPVGTLTNTPTPGAALKSDGTTLTTNTFIEWLRSLFVQLLSQQ